MTVPIEKANLRPESVLSGSSRYLGQNVIYWGDKKLITFDTYIRRPYVVAGDEKIFLIPKTYEYRPDLVAYKIYRTSELWWFILEANGMKDIMDFKSGKTIIIPNQQ